MRSARYLAFPVLLAVAATLVACGGDEPGQPQLAPTSQISGDTGESEAGAPAVASPLPASLIKGDPCKALTAEQVKTLFSGVEPDVGPARDTGAAMQCTWANLDRGSSVGIQLVYAWENGLDTVYSKKAEAELFEELEPVQGYPVVAYGPTDDRQTGRCNLAVGIADDAAFEADVKVADAKAGEVDPCEDARKVADLAVTTMKGQS